MFAASTEYNNATSGSNSATTSSRWTPGGIEKPMFFQENALAHKLPLGYVTSKERSILMGNSRSLVTFSRITSREASEVKSINSKPILSARNLIKAFGVKVVLDDASAEVFRGDICLLTGENGAGKTTLLNLLTGHLKPDSGSVFVHTHRASTRYSFSVNTLSFLQPWKSYSPTTMSNAGIGRTWQDIRLFPSLTIAEQVGVAFDKKCSMGRDLWSSVSRKEVDSLLDELGIADLANSRGDSVSLGQAKRVAIARAVASGAELIFLDEPLAGLDAKGIESVIEMLSRLVRSKGLSLVIVEHVFNHRFLDSLVTRELRLEKGKLSDRPLSVTNTVSSSEKTTASLGGFSPLVTSNAQVAVEQLPRGAVLTRIRHRSAYSPDAQASLEINNLVVSRGNRSVIGVDDYGQENGLSLSVRPGEIAILQAPNGWGKSTLFDALTNTIPIAKGHARIAPRLIAIPSDNYLFHGLTVRESARLSASPLDNRFESMANRKCGSLSGGEGKRLAMLALKDDAFWVMDEPFNGLDSADELLTRIDSHLAAGNGAFVLTPLTIYETNFEPGKLRIGK